MLVVVLQRHRHSSSLSLGSRSALFLAVEFVDSSSELSARNCSPSDLSENQSRACIRHTHQHKEPRVTVNALESFARAVQPNRVALTRSPQHKRAHVQVRFYCKASQVQVGDVLQLKCTKLALGAKVRSCSSFGKMTCRVWPSLLSSPGCMC